MIRTNVYVDGFNLYFGCLKGTPYRWVNVHKLSSLLLHSQNQINKIMYFTAEVSARPGDLQQPVRQQMYYRALKTIPNLEIIRGQFQTRKVKMPLVNNDFDPSERSNNHIFCFRSHNDGTGDPENIQQHIYRSAKDLHNYHKRPVFEPLPKDKTQSVYVWRTDEKGSDVNLATHLLYDACRDDFDAAVVVSNDSDLTEAIRLSVSLGKTVGVLNPQQKPVSTRLRAVASFSKPIRSGVLLASQFPDTMRDSVGEFTKPSTW